jgi:L-serine dehydratase
MRGGLRAFDIFKIGVGPSSSHTLGPWRAAQRAVQRWQELGVFDSIEGVQVDLYGSLAKTGRGHMTDMAVMLGLSNQDPVPCDTTAIPTRIDAIRQSRTIDEGGLSATLPFPIESAKDLLGHCNAHGLTVPEVVWRNELVWRTPEEIHQGLGAIWKAMKDCVFRGCHTRGVLPGGLGVVRRAAGLSSGMLGTRSWPDVDSWIEAIRNRPPAFQETLAWVSCFALAVNEENAGFGRVVTAPTNGAAGVVPAVLLYYLCFCKCDERGIERFLLTAGEIGSIIKKEATISAAMGGCQAEIGVSSAMAAAGLTQCLGGSPAQVAMPGSRSIP